MSESKRILKELKERFLDGDKLSVREIVDEYFDPKTPYTYLVANKKAKGYINSIKQYFKSKHGIWIGRIGNDGKYGVATTIEEVGFAVISSYKFIKGNVRNTQMLVGNAKQNGILPTGLKEERLLISRLEEKEDEN